MKFAIIGYGAAGTFAALQLRQSLLDQGRGLNDDQIYILEKNRQGLRKVKISGGGRCNVTHHQFNIKDFTKNYPRGEKELIGPFHTFQAQDTVNWFKERGVEIKVEGDGRMFPKTNSSQSIIDCFEKELKKSKIDILFQHKITAVKREPDSFVITFDQSTPLEVKAIMLATGSDPSGYLLAEGLGHTITDLAPSLFTFKINDPLLKELSGTSFAESHISIKGLKKKWQEKGPLLITHWGLSGPCVLKLSAWAARELKSVNYQFNLTVNWLGKDMSVIKADLQNHLEKNKQKKCINAPLPGITKNFWLSFINQCSKKHPKILDKQWGELSKNEKSFLESSLFAYPLRNKGLSRFKEEFVECGGISTKEVNFKSMESRLVPGLFFGGEILDIDGVTGGFNFQNAWTTGFIAGENLAKKL